MKRIILITVLAILWSGYLTGQSETHDREEPTCPKQPMCTYYYEKQDTPCSCNGGEIGNVFIRRNIRYDEPMKGDDETSDPRTLSKRILNGLEVPFTDNITRSTFKATFPISDNETGFCNVNFVEKSHLLATSASCCYTKNFPVGPRLELTNGTLPFKVDVFATLVPGTYVPGKANDFCLIVLNKAVPDVDPLEFSFTSSNVNDTIHVFSFGPIESDGPLPTRLQTGIVTVESTDYLGVIRVRGKNAQVCDLDSGGASKNNGRFHGIVMGNKTICSKWTDTIGAISQFKPLEVYIKDAVARFPVPPGE